MWLMDMTLLFLDWVIKLVLVSNEIKNISRALAELKVREHNSVNAPPLSSIH